MKEQISFMFLFSCFAVGNSSNAMEPASESQNHQIIITPDIDPIIIRYAYSETKHHNLSEVCNYWYGIIQDQFLAAESQLKQHYNISEDNYLLLKGIKVVYKSDPANNLGMKIFKIPAFSSPFDFQFVLSECGEAGKHVCIKTGYRRESTQDHQDKTVIWITPRCMVVKDLETIAPYYKRIMHEWLPEVPFGLFYVWGNWYDLNWYSHLVTQRPPQINIMNCYQLFAKADQSLGSVDN